MAYSVVIPSYGRSEDVSRCIDSLRHQTLLPAEVILVDDGSPIPLISDHARVVRHKIRRGPAAARNTGIREARPDSNWIAFIDSDCVAPSNWLENLDRANRENCDGDSSTEDKKNTAAICGSARINSKGFFGETVSLLGYPAGAGLGFEKMWEVQADGSTKHISGCNFAVRRDFIAENGIWFDERITRAACEDVLFAREITSAGGRIVYSPDLFVWHSECESIWQFLKWHYVRGGAIPSYGDRGRLIGAFRSRISSLNKSIKSTPYITKKAALPLLFGMQVAAQGLGLVLSDFRRISS